MGWTVGWFAVTGSSVEEAAILVGCELGDELDYAEGMCIASIGDWVLVYNDEEPLLGDDELEKLSADRSVVVHESVDSVMYARTARWHHGELASSATVNLDTVDDDRAVSVIGLAAFDERQLRRAYQQSGPGAYSAIAERARALVGFRHDVSHRSGIRFRALIDTRKKPPSTSDRVATWLTSQGFEAKETGADGSDDRSFRRHFHGEFWLIAEISRDRYQFSDDWSSVNLGIHHESAALIVVEKRSHGRVRQADPFEQVGRYTYAIYGSSGEHRPAGEDSIPFRTVTDSLRSRLAEVEAYCTEELLLSICHPSIGLALEVALGWSNRSESYLAQAEVHNRLLDHHNTSGRPVDFGWLEAHRAAPRTVQPAAVTRTVDDLKRALNDDEVLSGPELAVVQADLAASEDHLLEALAFGHWVRVLDIGSASPAVAVHFVRHHLLQSDAEAVARAMEMAVEVQLELAGRPEINIPFQLGFNTRLDPRTQILLAEKQTMTVGGHPDLVPEAQRLLMAEPAPYLAKNPALLPELQPELAASSNYQVREGLAQNRSVLPEVLAKLVKDRKGDVKWAAAANPRLPEKLQYELLEKTNRDTQTGLMRNAGLTPAVQQLVAERGELAKLAENTGLLRELMETLASDPQASNREALARNLDLPIDLQDRLANDPAPAVRRYIAHNYSTDPAIRARLVHDEDESVSRSARDRARFLGETSV